MLALDRFWFWVDQHLHTEPSYVVTPPNVKFVKNWSEDPFFTPPMQPFALSFDPREVYFSMNPIDVPLHHLRGYRYMC